MSERLKHFNGHKWTTQTLLLSFQLLAFSWIFKLILNRHSFFIKTSCLMAIFMVFNGRKFIDFNGFFVAMCAVVCSKGYSRNNCMVVQKVVKLKFDPWVSCSRLFLCAILWVPYKNSCMVGTKIKYLSTHPIQVFME